MWFGHVMRQNQPGLGVRVSRLAFVKAFTIAWLLSFT